MALFKKGHKKVGGREKGTPNKYSLEAFRQEFEADCNKLVPVLNADGTPKLKNGKPVKARQGSLYKYFYERARKNDTILDNLMKKLVPDKRESTVTLKGDEGSNKTPAEILEDMVKATSPLPPVEEGKQD